MKFIKRHFSGIILAVFVCIAGAGFFVQKLTVKEFQGAENLKHESKKEVLDAAKQAAKLRLAYSSSLDEFKSIDKQVDDSAGVKAPSKPKNAIYEKPSGVVYLAQ